MMKLFLILTIILTTTNIFAKTVARVSNIKGSSFVFYGKSGSATLKYGDKIADLSEVMVEDDSSLSLFDYNGHTFHLAGGTHIKFTQNKLEVKNGKIWVRSDNKEDLFYVNSVNSSSQYKNGEFIFSFSNVNGKGQLLVIEGDVKYHNTQIPEIVENIGAGFFSIIDKDFNNGIPRRPTRIGENSYTKMKLSFKDVDTSNNSSFEKMLKMQIQPKRTIASVASTKKGKMYFYQSKKTSRSPSSINLSPIKYYEKVKKNKKSQHAKVRIFGGLDQKSKKFSTKDLQFKVKIESARKPASIETEPLINDLNSSFENSLKNQIRNQKKHPKEVNRLIDELKSYDKNYTKNY